jgi:hypothetical protein
LESNRGAICDPFGSRFSITARARFTVSSGGTTGTAGCVNRR